jgi:NitT/TauT family transport system ATP-binding protein
MGVCIDVRIEEYYHDNQVGVFFKDVNIDMYGGNFYLLMGKSGIGKTTLLKIVLGINHGVLKGRIDYKVNGEIYNCEAMKMRGMLGYQSDQSALIPWKTVYDNILLPSVFNKELVCANREKIINELKMVGLDENCISLYPHELSYGMRARIGLVRAALWSPEFLFIDELFSGIDSYNNKLICDYLEKKIKNSIIVGITHNIEKVYGIVSKVIYINSKREAELHEKGSMDYLINLLK